MESNLLKACRVIVGFSQREMAEALGINQATLSRYETGFSSISDITRKKVIEVLAKRGLSQEEILLLDGLKNHKE